MEEERIRVTSSAAAFFQRVALQQGMSFFAVDEDKKTCYLRVKAVAGGCSGIQYALELEESSCELNPTDTLWCSADISVVVDEKSKPHLLGLVIDYKDDLMDSGLKFTNPTASVTCGCGQSFR